MNRTQRMFSFIIILVVVTFFVVAGVATSQTDCECICEPTPALVLPTVEATLDAQTWWNEVVK